MAIYYYDGNQKSPPNYVGIRVNVMVAGKVKQKWFSFNTKYKTEKEQKQAREEAEALNSAWLMEKNLSKKRPERNRGEMPIYSTGVMGIKMKFKKVVTRRRGKSWTSYSPCFVINGKKGEKRYHKQYNMKTRGYDMAWLYACQYLAGWQDVRLDEIIQKKPPIEKMLMVLDWQRRNGDEIATKRLPNELLAKFCEDQSEETQQIFQNILTDAEKKQMKEGESCKAIFMSAKSPSLKCNANKAA